MKKYLIQNGSHEIAVTNNLVKAIFKEEEAMHKNLETNMYHDLFSIVELNKDGSTSSLPLHKIIKARTKLLKFEHIAQGLEPKMKDNGQTIEDRTGMLVEYLISYLS